MTPRIASSPRRRTLAVVLVAALAVTASCSSDGSDDDDARTTTTEAASASSTTEATSTTEAGGTTSNTLPPADDEPTRLARLCNEALDLRTFEVSEASREASLAALTETRGGGDLPDDATLDGWADALDANRAELEAIRDVLLGADVEPDQAEAWAVVTGAGDDQIDLLAQRAEVLRTHDAERIRDGYGSPDGGPGLDDLEQALVDLGVGRSDCETALNSSGAPEASRDFVLAAADACTTVVVRRQAGTFEADTTTVLLKGVRATIEDETVAAEDRPAVQAAAEAVLAEWEATLADLEAVDATDASDPAAWQATLAVVADRVQGFEQRVAAVTSGDDAEIARAFNPDVFEEPGFEDLEVLGLAQRDCRAILA